MSRIMTGSREDSLQEPERTQNTTIQYRRLQPSSFVTTAAVARFTDPRVLQLVIFKEMAMEVWEVEVMQQRKVISVVLERLVSHCCVLETSKLIFSCQKAASTPLHLDLLLVTDGSGGLTVWEWNETLSEVRESGRVNVHLSPELQSASAVLPSTPLFSCPLYLPKRGSWQMPFSANDAQNDTTSKVEGIALVAMSIYQGMLGILCVEWISTLLKQCGVCPLKPSLALRLNLYFLPLPTEKSMPGPLVPITNPCVVRGLAFVGAHEGAGYGSLDLKGRPLLVVLSSQQGFIYHSLRLQCMALDLSVFQLRPGPWEIRNLNPSTSLLLPWSFVENLGGVVGIHSAYLETGLRPGSGVLAMSSAGVMFIEASGRRTSLPFHLDGLPTCWIRLPQSRLVVGDGTGALHVLELSNWQPSIISKISLNSPLPPVKTLLHVLSTSVPEFNGFDPKARQQNSGDNIIFASGQAGDSQLLKLICTPVELSIGFLIENRNEWTVQNLAVNSSAFLESLAPGSLVADFHVDTIMEAELRGLPQLLPFHESWGSEFHTHILVTYPIVHVSEVVTISGAKTEENFMHGLERRRCTLALSALPGGWFIQITETSLRVLGKDLSSRDLRAEWKLPFRPPDSPRDLRCSENIHHAALTPEGALLVSGAAIHSVELDCFGVPHTIASSDRPHQVSALGLCHVGDSCLHTIARVLVVVIAQWTSNTVHLLSWPNLEEIVTMDACTAPVLSVSLGRLAMNNYLFAGTADGNLVYYELLDIKRSSSGIGEEEATNLENLPSEADEEVKESKRMLRRIRNMGITPSDLEAVKSTLESKQFEVPQYTLQHGRVIKVGSSITYMEFGCFNGGGDRGTSICESSMSEISEDCLYVWSERSLVLLPQHLQDFHAVVLHCQSHRIPKSTKLHREEHPHGLVGATTNGQILCGHLDLSINLRWQVLKIDGTAVHLAHHRSSGCIAFTSIDGVSSNLHIVHEESMLQLLIVELKCNHFPKVLTTLHLPYTMCCQNAESVECLVVATQTMNEQQTEGLLLFFDVQVNYASEEEVKYELHLLGLHPLDEPCHSLCMVETPSKPFSPSSCTMCSLETLPFADDPWLMDMLQCLEHSSKHWSQCCSDRSSDPGALHKDAVVPKGSLLVLGFQGKIQLLYAFVGAFEECMPVVPSVAAAIDAPFLPSPGICEDFDRQPEDVVEERLTSDTEAAAIGRPGVQPTPAAHCGLATSWATSSRINIRKLASCATPGEGSVTSLIPISKGIILVVEKLHGLSVFEIAAEGSEISQLAWQPCSYPLEAVIPLSEDLYVLSMYGNGCKVMERDYPAEAACQEKLRKDLETELMSMQDQVQDGTPRSTILLELQRSSIERLPPLRNVAAASWPSTACHLSSGSMCLDSSPLTRMLTVSKMAQTIATVTRTGEIGIITVSRSSS